MKDVLLNDVLDLKIENADVVIGFSDNQQKEVLLINEKGGIKQYPDVGVGIKTFLENEDPAGLLREIRLQYAKDGMEVNKVGFDNAGKLQIDAQYT